MSYPLMIQEPLPEYLKSTGLSEAITKSIFDYLTAIPDEFHKMCDQFVKDNPNMKIEVYSEPNWYKMHHGCGVMRYSL